MKPIKAVLFDLDDTLIIDEAVSREAFGKVAALASTRYGADPAEFERAAKARAKQHWAESPCQAYCRRIGISAFECLWGGFEGATEDLTALRTWSHEYRKQVFDAALRDLEIEPGEQSGERLSEEFETQRRRLQRLMPDAREVLARLSQHYQIGLLTNGAPDLQREKLAASGLADFFNAVAVSGEHDIGKPKPEIFYRLCDELGVSPDEAVMVGNSMERDILGAKNAGILSVWIRVAGSEEHHDVVPDFEIIGLVELPGLLEEIGKPAISG